MYRRRFDLRGEMATLTRRGEVTASVRCRLYRPDTVAVGGDTLNASRVVAVVLADDLAAYPVPPRENDELTLGGRVYVVGAVDDTTRRVAGEIIAYELTVST